VMPCILEEIYSNFGAERCLYLQLSFHRSTWRYILGDRTVHRYSCQNLASHVIFISL